MDIKKCKCGFTYKDKKDLKEVSLLTTYGKIEYYCPVCKEYICEEKITIFS